MGINHSQDYRVILIEFLTKEEKVQKTIKLNAFYEKSENENNAKDCDVIEDPFSVYKTSFRQEVKIYKPYVLTIAQINHYLNHIDEVSSNDSAFKKMAHFLKRNVNKFFILFKENEITGLQEFHINVQQETEIVVLEVIYSKKSFGQQIVYIIEKGTKMFWSMILACFNLGTVWFVITSFINKSFVFKMALRYFFPFFSLIAL